ncbi:MAG TPA: NUDIX hydrolase [Candidatus Levybacteria bacterium]|nr:NUDIX hydrolase [Candidatus Levybacteria bacterium]
MKIPSHAKRVFKGVIFDVYHWEQEVFDGSTQTYEMLKRPNTVEVIATQGDKILLSHQSQPTKLDFYSLFGGRADENEEPLVTAKRELLEESGLESEDWELLKTYEPIHKIDWTIYTYIARDCKKTSEQTLDVGEKIEIVECTFDEFIDIVISEKYWGTELTLDVLRMKNNQRKLEQFKNLLFQSQV